MRLSGRPGTRAALALLPLAATLASAAHAQQPQPARLLVALTETGESRDGLPVLAISPNAALVERDLALGASGELLQIYAWVQYRLSVETGQPVEPAYILQSSRQGGFPRYGFFLGDVDKRHAAYVDVHRDWPLTGKFGAVDQLFPHELAHVLRKQLVGEILEGNTNQVHALGVRTDRIVAMNEGFAEHFQPMAIDHPDAHPSTAALAGDLESVTTVNRRLQAYRRELEARVAFAPPLRVGFVAWFANGEDVLRYSAVKANAFARRPTVPARLLHADPYEAYLLESIVPAAHDAPARSVGRLASTEAVVAALYYRWASDSQLQNGYQDEAFYEPFGTDASAVSPRQNVYLKLFDSLLEHRPWDVLAAIDGYKASFPDDAARVDELVGEIFLGQPLVTGPEIWLLNEHFHTGTTIFDQYRGMPRPHTFDLNAASLTDLVAIPGVGLELAERLQRAAPFEESADVARVRGVPEDLPGTLQQMADAMERLRAGGEDDEELTLSIWTMMLPNLWRALGAIAAVALIAGLASSPLRRRSGATQLGIARNSLNALAAGLIGCIAGWALGPAGAFGVPAVVLGLAGAVLEGRHHGSTAALGVLAAWCAAAVAAVVATTPW